MDYEKIYGCLIQKRRDYPIEKANQVCECHHITPKSFDGSNQEENLVNLTPREHFVAHLLLVKICKEKYGKSSSEFMKMAFALYLMANTNGYKINSRMYERIRADFIEQDRIRNTGKNNPMYGVDVRTLMTPEAIAEMERKRIQSMLGHEVSQTTREKIGVSNSGKKNGMYGKQVLRGKKCMFDPKSGKYKYVEPNRIQEHLDAGFVFQGSNKGKKIKNPQNGTLVFYKSHLHKGKRLMINESGSEVYVDPKNKEDVIKYGEEGYKFVNKRYNYLIKEFINEL